MKTLKDLDVRGKKVLMRVDLNVPLNDDGTVADDTRIREALPSIKYVLKEGGKLILMSHMGRPEGKCNPKLSLAPCANHLSFLLQKEVKLAPDCVGTATEQLINEMQPSDVVLLENLRFHQEEEHPDPTFVKALAKLGEAYVNDAFATAHRKHASTAVIAESFPQNRAAGFLMEKEVEFLSSLMLRPKRPFYAILGGAKIHTKLGVLASLVPKIDAMFIGGGMAFIFFKIRGIEIGDSICDDSSLLQAENFLKACEKKGVPVYLPYDIMIVKSDAKAQIVPIQEGIPAGWKGVDIGPKTMESWSVPLEKGKTIFWNGPMGIFEIKNFANGTRALTQKLSALSATTIVGGGDSVAAVKMLHAQKKFTHISTGGGASLEYIEYGHLPGIDALA